MTPIEYMEKQLRKHRLNLERAIARNAPEEDVRNIKLKIFYYEAAVEALVERTTGIIRRFDDLGRIVIPKNVREAVFGKSNTEGEPMEIFYGKNGTIILKPYKLEDDKC